MTDEQLAEAFASAFKGQFIWSKIAEEDKWSWSYRKFSRWNQLRDEFGIITISHLRDFAQTRRERDISATRLTNVLEMAKPFMSES